jgi:replication-associated recombination protein RarA
MNTKNVVELINKAKEAMTKLGIPEEEQTIEAVCIFAKAAKLSDSNKAVSDEVTLGVMEYDYDF